MPNNDEIKTNILDGLVPLDTVHGEDIRNWGVRRVYANPEETRYVLEIRREVGPDSWEQALVEIEGRLKFTSTAIKIGLGTKLTKLGVTHERGP